MRATNRISWLRWCIVKIKIKLWCYFGLLFLFGAFFSAGLFFAYGILLRHDPSDFLGASLSLGDAVRLSCFFLEPLSLIFLSSFTLFSCAISSISCLLAGVLLGQTAMKYCLSPLTPFTHAASLIFLLGYGALFTVLSSHAALFRSKLRYAAPDLKQLVKDKSTQTLLYNYLAVSTIALTLSAALYFVLHYFPIS